MCTSMSTATSGFSSRTPLNTIYNLQLLYQQPTSSRVRIETAEHWTVKGMSVQMGRIHRLIILRRSTPVGHYHQVTRKNVALSRDYAMQHAQANMHFDPAVSGCQTSTLKFDSNMACTLTMQCGMVRALDTERKPSRAFVSQEIHPVHHPGRSWFNFGLLITLAAFVG